MTDTIQVSRAEYEALRRDAERINWLEQQNNEGDCLALIYDDNGHWAVSDGSVGSVCMKNEPEDFHVTFFGEAEKCRKNIRDAIDAAINMPANAEGGE